MRRERDNRIRRDVDRRIAKRRSRMRKQSNMTPELESMIDEVNTILERVYKIGSYINNDAGRALEELGAYYDAIQDGDEDAEGDVWFELQDAWSSLKANVEVASDAMATVTELFGEDDWD